METTTQQTNPNGATGAQTQQPQNINIHTAPAPRDFPEMPYSANVRAVDADGFEWQFTARAVNEKPFMERIEHLRDELKKRGYKPVTGRAASVSTSANEPQAESAPLCAIHNAPMQKRQGRGGQSFWSCPKKLDNGDWCPYRPKQ